MARAMERVRVLLCDACASWDQELESAAGGVVGGGFHHLPAVVFLDANF